MKTIALFVLCVISVSASAQTLSLQQAIEAARVNNKMLHAASYEVDYQRQLKHTSLDLPKTDVSLMYGQYNSIAKNDNNVTIMQTVPFTALGSQAALNRSLLVSAEFKRQVTENTLVYQVKQVYYQLAYLKARHQLLQRQDSIYTDFIKSSTLRFETGETNLLEKTTAETQGYEVKNMLRESEADITVYRSQLQVLINSESLPDIQINRLEEIPYQFSMDTSSVRTNPMLGYMRQQTEVATNQKRVELARLAPDFHFGYFNQTLIGNQTINGQDQYFGKNFRFQGFVVGLSLPIWVTPYMARIKAAEFNRKAMQSNYEYQQQAISSELRQAIQQLTKNRNSLDYYKRSALPNSTLILRQADLAFKNGEIGFTEYLVSVRNAIGIQENYLRTLNNYNQSIIQVQFITGNKTSSNEIH